MLPRLNVPEAPVWIDTAVALVPPWIKTVCAAVVFPRFKPPVVVPVATLTAKLLEALRLIAPPEMLVAAPLTVRPAKPVSNPALVTVPVPEVEMLPEVVMASPAVAVETVVPERLK